MKCLLLDTLILYLFLLCRFNVILQKTYDAFILILNFQKQFTEGSSSGSRTVTWNVLSVMDIAVENLNMHVMFKFISGGFWIFSVMAVSLAT